MDIIIGSLTAFMSLVAFHFFEKKRISHIGNTKYLYFLYVVLIAYLIKPSQEPLIWLGFLPLLYCVLDDMKSRTLNIYLPLLASIIFLGFIDSPYFIGYALFVFLVFLLFSKATKETFIGEGDIYISLPLLLFLSQKASSISLLSSLSLWGEALLVSSLFAASVIVPANTFGKAINSFPFVPFLILGFSFTYVQAPWTDQITPYLFILVALLYILNFAVKILKLLHKKK